MIVSDNMENKVMIFGGCIGWIVSWVVEWNGDVGQKLDSWLECSSVWDWVYI